MRVTREVCDLNVTKILRFIWHERKTSRIQIASALRMDKSTVTKTVAALLQKNIILETEFSNAGPKGGRKPVFLEMNSGCTGAAGIFPEEAQTSICLANFNGEILFESILQNQTDIKTPEGFLSVLKNAVSVLKKSAARLHLPLGAAGIALKENKTFSLPQKIEGIPVFAQNDARCACFAEQFKLNGEWSKNIIFILCKNGLEKASPAFFLNGQPYCGADSAQNEFRIAQVNTFADFGKKIAFLAEALRPDYIFIGGLEKESSAMLLQIAQNEMPAARNSTKILEASVHSIPYGAAIMAFENFLCEN